MKEINIDLTSLTQDHLDECESKLGYCTYAAPCIIGTLIPEELRNELARRGIKNLMGTDPEYRVKAPVSQHADIVLLQAAFDNSRWREVVEIARKYI